MQLTAASWQRPALTEGVTLYTALRIHAKLYLAAMPIYAKVISKPLPSAGSLIDLDDRLIGQWYNDLPLYFNKGAVVPSQYRSSHAVMMWKYRNLRIIMFRSFVIRQMFHVRQCGQ